MGIFLIGMIEVYKIHIHYSYYLYYNVVPVTKFYYTSSLLTNQICYELSVLRVVSVASCRDASCQCCELSVASCRDASCRAPIVFELWLQYRKARFHSNAGMCSHSDHIIQIFRINYLLLLVCIAIRLHWS